MQGWLEMNSEVFETQVCIYKKPYLPPSVDELQKRLIARGYNTADEIERRLQKAKKEIEKSSNFDHIVVNENIDSAISEVTSIILRKLVE